MFAVNKSIIDLRKEPTELTGKDYSHDPLRLTQLLYNEPVQLLEKCGKYYYVEVPLHEHHSQEGWHGYRGYVHASEVIEEKEFRPPTHVVNVPWTQAGKHTLSFGTYLSLDEAGFADLPDGSKTAVNRKDLRPLHSPFCRIRLVNDARHFLGAPYLWGGTGAHGEKSSVDCSGFIYLLYRAQGIIIPRDAHPQALKGRKIDFSELQSGDLIYLSRESHPTKISHVLLYKDKEAFLESTQTGEYVREEKFATHVKHDGKLLTITGRSHRYFPTCITFL